MSRYRQVIEESAAADISGYVDDDGRWVSVETIPDVLAIAGGRYAEARGAAEQLRQALHAAIRAAVAEGMTEVDAAKTAGVDRMTVRRALGKR